MTPWEVLLAAGATGRLTRLVVRDDAGEPVRAVVRAAAGPVGLGETAEDLMSCPHCTAVWCAALVVGGYRLPGWRAVCSVLGVAWVAGHVSARVDGGV